MLVLTHRKSWISHTGLKFALAWSAVLMCFQASGQEPAEAETNPYSLRFEDFAWKTPAQLKPIQGAVPLSITANTGLAIAEFERRIATQPQDFANRSVLGSLLLRHAKESDDLIAYKRSEEILRDALKNNGDYQPAKLALARTLMARHEFTEALRLAEEVNAATPSKPASLAVLFDCHLELGEHSRASHILHQLQAMENSAPILARAARLCELAGEREKAISLIDSAIDDLESTSDAAPDSLAWYLWRKGTLQFDTGMIHEAQDSFMAGLALVEDDEPSLVGLAHAQFALGDLASATATLEKAAASLAPPVLAMLGDAYQLRGESDKAQNLWRQTEEIMQEEAKVAKVAHAREVAMFYADHDRNLAQALQLSEIDLAQRSDPLAWDCHAWASFKNQQIEPARESIRKALKRTSGDCNVLYHAAVIEKSAGDLDAAREYVDRIQAINPNFSITYFSEFSKLRSQLEPLQ